MEKETCIILYKLIPQYLQSEVKNKTVLLPCMHQGERSSLYSFLNLALYGGELSAHAPAVLSPREWTPKYWMGHAGVETGQRDNPLPLLGS
jgi:hypothetical protein